MRINIPNIKSILSLLLALQIFFACAGAVFAQSPSITNPPGYSGVEQGIRDYLCAPTDAGKATSAQNNPAATDLYQCINKLYRFAIAGGSVMAIFFIVIAGYLYMSSEGSQERVDKAKSMLESSIAAVVILFAGYILLKAINPDLLQFQSVQPPSVVIAPATSTGGGGTPKGGGSCSALTDGNCSASLLAKNCSAWGDGQVASAICNRESGGGNASISSGTDHCVDDKSFSIGLFQINMITDAPSYLPQECPKSIFVSSDSQPIQTHCAVDKVTNGSGVTYCPKWNCKVNNLSQYNTCVQALSQASTNIPTACKMYSLSNTWKKWQNSYNVCITP